MTSHECSCDLSKFGFFFFLGEFFFMPWFDKNDVFYIRIRFLATIYTWKDSNSRKRNVWCDKSHVWTHLVAIKVGTHRASTWRPKCERKKVDSDMVKWAQSGPMWPLMSSQRPIELLWPLMSSYDLSRVLMWPLRGYLDVLFVVSSSLRGFLRLEVALKSHGRTLGGE